MKAGQAHSYNDAERRLEAEKLPREERLKIVKEEYLKNPDTDLLSNLGSLARYHGLPEIAEKIAQLFCAQTLSKMMSLVKNAIGKNKQSAEPLSSYFYAFSDYVSHTAAYAAASAPKNSPYSKMAATLMRVYEEQDVLFRDFFERKGDDYIPKEGATDRALTYFESLLIKLESLQNEKGVDNERQELETMLGITPETRPE